MRLPKDIPIIGVDQLRRLIDERGALQSAELAFRALGSNRAYQPAPIGLELGDKSREVHVKTAGLEGASTFAVKVASSFQDNKSRGLPAGSGLMMLFCASTGFPLAILLDHSYLTDLRTGAAGALAAKHLTRNEFETLLVVGAGVQARYQIRAISKVMVWGRTLIWGRDQEAANRCCEEIGSATSGRVQVAASLEAAVRQANIVITVTSSRSALVRGEWLRPDATVIAVGSDNPDKQELFVDVLARADKVIADHLEQCLHLGEIHHAVEAGALDRRRIYAEFGQIVDGQRAGREGDEMIVCDLTGTGAQDTAIAEKVWMAINETSLD